jgi:hypothetical protein
MPAGSISPRPDHASSTVRARARPQGRRRAEGGGYLPRGGRAASRDLAFRIVLEDDLHRARVRARDGCSRGRSRPQGVPRCETRSRRGGRLPTAGLTAAPADAQFEPENVRRRAEKMSGEKADQAAHEFSVDGGTAVSPSGASIGCAGSRRWLAGGGLGGARGSSARWNVIHARRRNDAVGVGRSWIPARAGSDSRFGPGGDGSITECRCNEDEPKMQRGRRTTGCATRSESGGIGSSVRSARWRARRRDRRVPGPKLPVVHTCARVEQRGNALGRSLSPPGVDRLDQGADLPLRDFDRSGCGPTLVLGQT